LTQSVNLSCGYTGGKGLGGSAAAPPLSPLRAASHRGMVKLLRLLVALWMPAALVPPALAPSVIGAQQVADRFTEPLRLWTSEKILEHDVFGGNGHIRLQLSHPKSFRGLNRQEETSRPIDSLGDTPDPFSGNSSLSLFG
jgi:hypothetical protein